LKSKNWHLFSPAIAEERGCQGFTGLIPSTFLDKYFFKELVANVQFRIRIPKKNSTTEKSIQ